jgi:hypothetical protein
MTAPATISDGPVFHFALTNPHAETEREVAAILRQAADSIEELGDVDVLDITFLSEPADNMDSLLRVVVYYTRPGMQRLQSVPDAAG